jgi:hypothetical protein
MPAKIFVSFRFHGNFYHSYRGDTPDELGFGKDIRIIRNTIKTLDELNAEGIAVRGTWDFENYFSLEKIMPAHCPDIIEAFKRRVASGMDEIEYMSYNNGLVSASTAAEFDAAIGRAVTNPEGSGLKDLFGENVKPIVRPQEMMYTPSHIGLYPKYGINTISLFYSSIPFNCFSTFIPPLGLVERHNPLKLTYPGIEGSMTLLPCYNAGDLIDNLGLKNWIKSLRKKQLALIEPKDLLLIIDMDADDDFWFGFDVPVLKNLMAMARGLDGIVRSISPLDYVEFTTPGRYLETHAAAGSISFGQDTADGSFDGLSSWAEKWDNHMLWTGIERSRILELQTRHLAGMAGLEGMPGKIGKYLAEAFDARIKALSTTHFGMAAPVMNVTRLRTASSLVWTAVSSAADAFNEASAKVQRPVDNTFMISDYLRGISMGTTVYEPRPSKALIKVPVNGDIGGIACGGTDIPAALHDGHLYFIESMEKLGKKSYTVSTGKSSPAPENPVTVTEDGMDNGLVKIGFDALGNVNSIKAGDREISPGLFMNSGVTYDGKRLDVSSWSVSSSLALGVIGVKKMAGSLVFDSDGLKHVEFEREIILASNLPYIYLNMTVRYPKTSDKGYDKGKAQRLQQAWDARWLEVRPCEITPALYGRRGEPLKVIKHNYFGHVSSYELDYGVCSNNPELDSFNNHITNAWIAVSDRQSGVLLAQSADVSSSFAFCPMRTRLDQGRTKIFMNPFGSYWGRQWTYPTAKTGLGKLAVVYASAADHIKPYAPSYNGRVQKFSLMIAPFAGDMPPEEIKNDAMAYSYPYLILSGSAKVGIPAHRNWDYRA